MRKKYIYFFTGLIFLFIFVSCHNLNAEQMNIAVFDFDAQNVNPMEAAIVADFFRTALVNTNRFRVIDRENMETVLREQGFQQTGCIGKDSAVKLGQIMEVRLIALGTLSRLNAFYYITVDIVDVESGEILISRRVKCNEIDNLDTSMEELACKLTELQFDPSRTNGSRSQLKKPGNTSVKENEMILIPAGKFYIGSDLFAYEDSKPAKEIYVDAFFIDRYEVTNKDYAEFIRDTNYHTPRYWHNSDFNKPEQPVIGVTWWDADAYAKWAGKRLPTEAEWEKAARGSENFLYPWGNLFQDHTNICGKADGFSKTAPVGSIEYDSSDYNIYDMYGNVAEWVNDYYDDNYYKKMPANNPTGPFEGVDKVVRGYSWKYIPEKKNSLMVRFWKDPSFSNKAIGFRCARDAK